MPNPNQMEEELFEAALSLSSLSARRVFLDQACGEDKALRARLEKLLAVQPEAEQFFEGIPQAQVSAASVLAMEEEKAASKSRRESANLAEAPGTRIGRYKLLQRIGEGGCGAVYMAEQEQPVHRRVALKIIKLGMDTRTVIARFEAERQALAMMDHLNIARVFDAGATKTGRPYFVMELVRGVKITDYCDQNKLDTRQRLELFIQICHAIQHAHQKGIIHRDIKPSNILVTLHDGVPVPKVIDFGIAKAMEGRLTDKTLFTPYEYFIGTPAYMSPEQAERSGLDVDTRTDIYGLGVLLYELLTGRTPFDPKELAKSGWDGMRRTLREKDPLRPSTLLTTLQGPDLTTTAEHRKAEGPKLISLLRGDLDWIILRSLEKDRTRRYQTANALAMDIQRYLDNEPIMARPPSRLYRLQKLVRRNRMVFAAGGAVVLALVAGLGTSTWLLFRERDARRRAVAAEREESRLRREAETRQKVTQATALVREERFAEAEWLVSEINFAKPTVEGAALLRSLGEWHALRDEWRAAAKHFTALLAVNRLDGPDVDTLDYLECGPALIEAGDVTGYELFRQGAVAHLAETTPLYADRLIKVSLLRPADEEILRSLSAAAEAEERSMATNASADVFLAAWRSVSLGLMEYRRGRHNNAAEWCRRCLGYPEYIAPRSATAHVVLAMSCWQLGQKDKARSELGQGRGVIEERFKSGLERGTGVRGFWFDWVFGRILLREAETLIEGNQGPGNY